MTIQFIYTSYGNVIPSLSPDYLYLYTLPEPINLMPRSLGVRFEDR
jgi:hypothetical protein